MVTETQPHQSDGNTAFLRAARAGHLDKVLEQLKNNVDINTSNANGLNALHLASKDGHINVVSELLKRGAKVDSATKKGNTALHIASLAGQEEVVKHLVEHGASVNVQSQNGFTPLYMAAQENHDAVVRFLLANGGNQSLATEDGFTPLAVAMQQGHDKVVAVLLENDTRGKVRLPALHIAAKKDDTKAAALLLQNEHNPDVTSKSGFTPLHIASHYGNEAIANLLLSKGADVNFAAKHNITPLHVAAKWGKSNMVSVLLSKGANIEAKTRDGLTPLHCAARSGHEQVVDMLLERGAPISAKTKNGLAALHMSSQGDHVDAARILLYHRAPVDDVTVDYLTALHVAAHCGHVSVARLLLDRKADPNARALNGFTPLHIACKKNRIKVVELLLKHGASIEATTESGLTPLHVASFMGCMNIVIYLVQNEAGPDIKTVRGETPLHLAARANQTDIIRILLRNGAQVDARAREQQTPLHIASRLGNVDIVMLLLQHGASVDSTTKDLYTALHIAAKEGQDEVASVLLENGASLEATTKKGFTPLHLAAKYGHMNVAKLLLRRDAPVDAQGKNGVTPLHVASHYDHQNVALLLLEKGASPHATAKNGHTPLHIAARKNQMDIATTLLEYGAKANSESKAGFTPLHLSAQEGHADMSNLLIEHEADVNQKAKNGLTPLHLCSQEDRVEVGGILLKNQADVDSTTKAGYTPLHVACHFGQMGMVRLLLANGASVKPTTAVNYTPLHQAAQQGHSHIVNELLSAGADPNATTNQGQTAMYIAQKLGYISVIETLKGVTDTPISPTSADEKYKVVSPETMQETFMSDSEDEGGEDTMLSEQPYHYLTVDEMRGLGDDSLPIDVTRDERDNRDIDDTISPQHMKESYTVVSAAADNVDINRHPLHVGKLQWRNFLVSFLVDARGGAMRGVRHSGVRVIVPPRRAPMPLRVTCRYLKRDKLPHSPPLMEGEALASRILELGPVGAKFLGPVMIEVPHFGALRGKEREIVILRSDNGETWREHTFEATEEAVHDVLGHSFEKDEIAQFEENTRTTRILTTEFPHYIAVVSRVRQEVHAIGPEGGMVSSTVVPQVQAVFPHGALTKKIKVGLQAQPIPAELTAKLLGNRVAVSPIVTVEPRRRKFHKPISLTIPVPQAANKGMINQYSGDAPTLRLLCSITGGTTRAQWEDVTGSTPLTFVNDCVSFTTTVSARFWLMDCRNISEATKMATELYREAIHVPFMAKFVVFAKRVDTTEARLRVFCMTDDKEDKTLEHQEHFTEVSKSRDVEVLEGKTQYLEFAGNLIPVTKSGEQLQLGFRAFKENRLPFTVRVKDPHADAIGRTIFMREPKVAKGDVPQQPICILNIVLPEEIIPEPDLPEHEAHKHSYITHTSGLQRLSDISNLLGEDWVRLAGELGVSTSEVNSIKTDLCESSVAHQGLAMLRLWLQNAQPGASASNTVEQALRNIGRDDIIQQTVFQTGTYALAEELSPSYTTKTGIFKRIPSEKREIIEVQSAEERLHKDQPSIRERTPVIIEATRPKDDRRLAGEKDDRDEKKYEAEEKAVEEESLKSVSDRKKEIEKRLSQEVEEKTPATARESKIPSKTAKVTTKETLKTKETVITRETKETIKTEKKKLLDDTTEKETAEEKAVSPEPAHLSFDEKRKSFEMGITPKKKLKQQDSLSSSQLTQPSDVPKKAEQEVTESPKETSKADAEEAELSFAEKRRSFEQGLSMKQPGDKLPAADRTKEAATDRKVDEAKRASDFRRDSTQLLQEVSQGLDNIGKGIEMPKSQVLLSPGMSKTPPPSPAEFSKDEPDNKKWSIETESTLLPGQGKPQITYRSNSLNTSEMGSNHRTSDYVQYVSNVVIRYRTKVIRIT
ncbi:ankyrin 3, node of Ranvier (ankyrin G) [Nesidiocoris tenuis]|uniref:Ankyrin 3, node of Ranvier (Ankyrin G) n=1 Tax=Nesidiocoris tenuis TaxID=355587 RepID=A0ABN7A557_9HEMI|nr:ankyrin 3, node of Ranvier (ankyrin G) [Nesidiocoris tenuis]